MDAGCAGVVYTVKLDALEVVPLVQVTDTTPVPELPTTAVICVAVLEDMDATGTPPMVTAVAPDKLTPVIVMVEPGQPLDGEIPVILNAIGV